MLSRSQLLGSGMTRSQISWQVTSGRWQRLGPGTFLAHNGPVPEQARVWATVLMAGAEAVAGPRCSLWLHGAVTALPPVLDVCVPVGRHPKLPGVRVHRRPGLDLLRHPVLLPPRLRLEEAVLDETAEAPGPEQVVDLVLRVTQRRMTTAARLADRLAGRRAHRWRPLLTDVLSDVVDGVQSPLERRYRHDVERAHGLPAAERNLPERVNGGWRYRDARYARYGLVVELDGREAHPPDRRHADRGRDNSLALRGERTLRYGWREIACRACQVAGEVALGLRHGGWTGTPRRCGPGCRMEIE